MASGQNEGLDKRKKSARSTARKPDPAALLAWYDRNQRVLPWRRQAGERPDPYRIWVSEVMLQQTTVAAVIPYFLSFTRRWPTVQALAEAKEEDVLRQWAGLGYYRRARHLHQAAQVVCRDHGGALPCEEKALKALAGLGDYTVAALRAIAFDQQANVVDGNVERVMARLFAVKDPLPGAKRTLKALAGRLLPSERFGDYAQALMDLGATICTPRTPRCALCPWCEQCLARQKGLEKELPRRVKEGAKPIKKAICFALFDARGRVLLQKREDKGLLAGMTALPASPLNGAAALSRRQGLAYAPCEQASWRFAPQVVHHTFTHFKLELGVAVAGAPCAGRWPGRFVAADDWGKEALPSVMRKALAIAFAFYRRMS